MAEGLHSELLRKIKAREARVGVIGMGYVGLPLARAFARAGFPVTGFDIDEKKVQSLNRGESYIKHIPSEQVRELIERKRFRATSNFDDLQDVDTVSICVPTPINACRDPDLTYIENTGRSIAPRLRPGHLVVLESTTYPGTTVEVLRPILDPRGLRLGEDWFLAFSPEREDPGNPNFSTTTIPKVVGADDPRSLELAAALYGQIVVKVIPVSSTKVAEATKILENIYRCVNIALVNELKTLFDKMGIDIWEVIEAASTKPFGFQPFYPGPGLGGHCIPVDPFYLSWKARAYNVDTRFIELAGEVNRAMPEYVVHRLGEVLNDQGKALKGSKILVLGAAYKKDVDDMRESPSIEVIELLLDRGAAVNYNDPHIPRFPNLRRSELRLESVPLTEKLLADQDAVLILTDHSAYDYDFIVRHARRVVDTRNATRRVREGREKITKA